MKKKTFWTYLGRLLIAVILVIAISLIGIFIFDRYKPATSSFKNMYSTSYWDELDGFMSYDELKKGEARFDYTSSEYESPYDEDDTTLEKINKSRYSEELNLIIDSLNKRLTTIKNELYTLNRVNENLSKEDWIFQLLMIVDVKENEQLYTKIADPNLEYKGSEEDFTKVLANYETSNVYKQLVANGYKGKLINVMSAMLTASDSDELFAAANVNNKYENKKQWVIDVCGFNSYAVASDFSAYDFAVLNGYTGTFTDWCDTLNIYTISDYPYETIQSKGYKVEYGYLANDYDLYMAIYNDCGKKGVANSSAYELAIIKDANKINALEEEQAEINELIDAANSVTLPTLAEYFNRLQKVAENDNFEFWLSYGLTTFKVVDKRTGYEWYSNPENVETRLKTEQNTVLNVIYGTSAGAEIVYSNYTYSIATVDSKGRSVTPNYAIKITEREENGVTVPVIQVWYHLTKRGINYTYFPQYISEERINSLLEENARRAAAGQKDSDGKVIPDIKASAAKYEELKKQITEATTAKDQTKVDQLTKEQAQYADGYQAYSKWLNTWYNLLSEDSTEGKEKGFAYYEYKGGTFEFMSDLVINSLHKWMYEWCGYSASDLEEDNATFGVENEVNDPVFEVAIEYVLTSEGLQVMIPGNSIREYGDYNICKLDILPYFTSTPEGVSGYTIIPDGSGSILEHDNGKSNLYNPYIKRLYTTDLSETSATKEVESYDIMLPMYAVVNGSSAVIVEATQMASQLELRATTSGYGNLGETNNKNYFRAYLRESQKVYIGTYSKDPVQKFTKQLITEDIILNFNILGDTSKEYTYSDIAKIYREMLIKKYPNLANKHDTTTSPVLDLDVIGAYTYKDNFAGFSYSAKGTMTTYEELGKMIKDYKEIGIEYINVFYNGWRKEALVNTTFNSLKLNSLLGTKKQLKALVSENSNVTIYPYVSMGEVNEYQESFGTNHYTTRDVIGEIINKYPYDLSTNAYNTKAKKIEVVSPHYYYRFAESLVDSYIKLFGTDSAKKNYIGINSISIDKFGSALAGDYKKDNEMFKIAAIQEQIKSLELISSKIENINLYQPYDYAFEYVSHAKDIPFKSTQKELLDYSIPFYQLVINGMFDYSGESINVNIEEGVDYHIMKLIETGANPQFTFTYDSSSKLVRTDYNNYYNTEYTNWLQEVTTIYNTLVDLDIYSCQLVAHEKLDDNVYLVTYSNGAGKTIKIALNYSFASVNISGVGVISAKSYKVL